MMYTPKRIWIDCDPGADDALGITLLCRSNLQIAGIVSCFGNGSSVMTAENAAKVLKLVGREDVPVYMGAKQPLYREFSFLTLYCGEDGLCGSGLIPDISLLHKEDFASALINSYEETGQKIVYLITGAFTNLAKALLESPKIKNCIDEVVTASGCFELTEFANRSEWNIAIDPDAAKLVYESGIPIRAIGLDVTGQLRDAYTEELLHALPDNSLRCFIQTCTQYNQEHGLNISSILNDAMAASVIIDPSIAKYAQGNVSIDPCSENTAMMRFTRSDAGMVHPAYAFDFKKYLLLLSEKLS